MRVCVWGGGGSRVKETGGKKGLAKKKERILGCQFFFIVCLFVFDALQKRFLATESCFNCSFITMG